MKIIFSMFLSMGLLTFQANVQNKPARYSELVVRRGSYGTHVSIQLSNNNNAIEHLYSSNMNAIKKVEKLTSVPDAMNFMEQNNWKFVNSTFLKYDDLTIVCYYYFKKE
jgi:hypothetical protein